MPGTAVTVAPGVVLPPGCGDTVVQPGSPVVGVARCGDHQAAEIDHEQRVGPVRARHGGHGRAGGGDTGLRRHGSPGSIAFAAVARCGVNAAAGIGHEQRVGPVRAQRGGDGRAGGGAALRHAGPGSPAFGSVAPRGVHAAAGIGQEQRDDPVRAQHGGDGRAGGGAALRRAEPGSPALDGIARCGEHDAATIGHEQRVGPVRAQHGGDGRASGGGTGLRRHGSPAVSPALGGVARCGEHDAAAIGHEQRVGPVRARHGGHGRAAGGAAGLRRHGSPAVSPALGGVARCGENAAAGVGQEDRVGPVRARHGGDGRAAGGAALRHGGPAVSPALGGVARCGEHLAAGIGHEQRVGPVRAQHGGDRRASGGGTGLRRHAGPAVVSPALGGVARCGPHDAAAIGHEQRDGPVRDEPVRGRHGGDGHTGGGGTGLRRHADPAVSPA